MRVSVSVSVFALAVGALASGCDDKPAPTPLVAPAVTDAAATTAAVIPAAASSFVVPTPKDGVLDAAAADALLTLGAPSIVRVLDAGAEPRSVLRYDIPAGAKQSTDMRMAMELELRAAGNDLPRQKIPDLVMRIDLTAATRDAAGVHVEGVISKVTTEPKGEDEKKLARSMSAALAGIQGLALSYVATPDGRIRDVKIAAGAKVDPTALSMLDQMKQSFDSMVVPLPTEPVGAGAVWQVVGRMKAGAEVLQFSRFTLKKKQGAVIELESQVTQLAAARSMSVPGTGTGKLEEFRSGGKGTIRTDLGKLVPEQASGDVEGHVVSTVPGVGAMTVDTTLNLQFTPVSNEAVAAPKSSAAKP